MEDVADFFVGVALTAAGVLVTKLSFGLASPLGNALIGVGLGFVQRGLFGTPRPDHGEMQSNVADTQATFPVVYGGPVKVGLKIVETWVNPNSSDREQLLRAGVAAIGSEDGSGVEDLGRVWLDGKLAIQGDIVDGDTGSSSWRTTGRQSFFAPHMEYVAFRGTDSQVAPSPAQNLSATRYPSSWRLRGLAYLMLNLTKNKEVFPRVPNITMEVGKGNRVYDPRDSTWKFSRNPALALLDYLTSARYGCDYFYPERDGGDTDLSEIDEQSFISAANYCEEQVQDGSGGTQDRFQVNGWLDTGSGLRDNIDAILASCRGELVYQEGKFRLVIRQVKTSVSLELNETNIVGDWRFSRGGASEVPNRVVAAYAGGTSGDTTEEIEWPDATDTTFVDQDGGHEHTARSNLPLVQDPVRAEQIAMTTLREARQDAGVEVTVHEEALQLEVGDVVTVNHATPGWTGADAKDFWVMGMTLRPDGHIRLGLQEYDAAAYSLDPQTRPTDPPGSNLPDPTSVDPPTNLALTSDSSTQLKTPSGDKIPRILATWDKPLDVGLSHAVVQYKLSTASDWETAYPVDIEDPQRAIFAPGEAEEGDTVDVRVYVVTTRGLRSSVVSGSVVLSTDWTPNDLLSTIVSEDTEEDDFDSDGTTEGKLILTIIASEGSYDIQFETRQGLGTTWVSGANPTGLTSGQQTEETVDLISGRLSQIAYEVFDSAGVSFGRRVLRFDKGSDPDVAISAHEYTSTGEPKLSVKGDAADTEDVYAVANQGSDPPDPVITALSSNESAGSSSIAVDDESGFSAGDPVVVGEPGSGHETHIVSSTSAGTINLDDSLANSHSAGDPVVLAHAALDGRSGVMTLSDPDAKIDVGTDGHIKVVGRRGQIISSAPTQSVKERPKPPPPNIERVSIVGHTNNTCPGGDDLSIEWVLSSLNTDIFEVSLEFWGDWDEDGVFEQKDSKAASSTTQTDDATSSGDGAETFNVSYIEDGACVAVDSHVRLIIAYKDTGEVAAHAESSNYRRGWKSCFDNACASTTGGE